MTYFFLMPTIKPIKGHHYKNTINWKSVKQVLHTHVWLSWVTESTVIFFSSTHLPLNKMLRVTTFCSRSMPNFTTSRSQGWLPSGRPWAHVATLWVSLHGIHALDSTKMCKAVIIYSCRTVQDSFSFLQSKYSAFRHAEYETLFC